MCVYGLVFLATLQVLVPPASAQGPGDLCETLSGYMKAHPECLVLGYCREVECTIESANFITALSVKNCEDPVRLILRVIYSGSGTDVTYTFHVVEGQGDCTVPIELDSMSYLYVFFSRNESHVHFSVSRSWYHSVILYLYIHTYVCTYVTQVILQYHSSYETQLHTCRL